MSDMDKLIELDELLSDFESAQGTLRKAARAAIHTYVSKLLDNEKKRLEGKIQSLERQNETIDMAERFAGIEILKLEEELRDAIKTISDLLNQCARLRMRCRVIDTDADWYARRLDEAVKRAETAESKAVYWEERHAAARELAAHEKSIAETAERERDFARQRIVMLSERLDAAREWGDARARLWKRATKKYRENCAVVRAILRLERKHTTNLDQQLTAVRVALNAAGVPDSEPYPDEPVDEWERSLRAAGRMIPTEERVRRLAFERDELLNKLKKLEQEQESNNDK